MGRITYCRMVVDPEPVRQASCSVRVGLGYVVLHTQESAGVTGDTPGRIGRCLRSAGMHQQIGDHGQCQGPCVLRERVALVAGVHDELARGLEVLAGAVKPPGDLGR